MAVAIPGPAQPQWTMHPNVNAPNRKFKDEYELKEELGKGGFGVVRRCILKSDKSEYAVKVNNTPDKKHSMDEEYQWSQVLCSPFGHENIINMFDSIVESTTRFNIYELATGGDLMDDIISREYYSETDASIAFEQIVRGTDFIHSKGFLHRDLKPHNLLLKSKKSNVIKVTDFGLFCKREPHPQLANQYIPLARHRAGTPGYFSPEVSKQQAFDTDCDMFSCGVILYQLIAGYLPFWDEDATIASNNLESCTYEFPSPEWDGLDAARDLIRKLLTVLSVSGRLDANAVLQHHFITNRAVSTSPVHRQQTIDAFAEFQKNRERKKKLLNTYWQSRHSTQKPEGTSGKRRLSQ